MSARTMPKQAPDDPAAVLVVDCPWKPRDSNDNGGRGASHKYATIATADLCKLELPARAERHVLFFWRLASMVPDALQVLDAWGYVACAELVWCKLRPCLLCCATGRVDAFRMSAEVLGQELLFVPGASRECPACKGLGGAPMLGLGHYTRGAHEVCVIARRKNGRAPDRLDLGVSSVFSAPMLVDVDGLVGKRGGLVHSAKPDAAYEQIERLYAGPRVEMFSRRTRPGWTSTASDQDGRLDEVARVMRDVWPRREREARLAKARRRT
jgi:N6-adenosine-specific RNA methylase IME4